MALVGVTALSLMRSTSPMNRMNPEPTGCFNTVVLPVLSTANPVVPETTVNALVSA